MAHSIGPKAFPASLRKILGKGENWRALGDAARDRKDWAEAASHYRQHLDNRPRDVAIWVQLGHSLKESRHFEEAEIAYKTGLGLRPDDADLHLQLGHLLKIMGRAGEAMDSYATSSRLQPTSPAATEIAALQRRVAPHRSTALATQEKPEGGHRQQRSASGLDFTGRVFLPVDDLFVYLHHHRTVSGIQRVQLNFFSYVMGFSNAHEQYVFMFCGPSRELRAIPTDSMAALIDAFGSPSADHNAIRRMIASAKARAQAVQMRPADTCFIVGSFWNPGGNPDFLSQVKQSKARLGIYFYDLIPVTHREYVVSELSAGFAQALVEALSFVDFAFGISEYTTKAVEYFVAQAKLRPFPISPVRLAHGQLAPAIASGLTSERLEFATGLQGRPFVLCVGTIEARKNHRYLFDVWKALVAEGIEPPKLVLVGRQGWRVDDLMAQIEATRFLDGRIVVLHDVSDVELDTLYQHCLFTIFPSIVEGWGLPIGESLSHGKLCVASNTTSMPEVGGDLVEYFDPWNLHSGLDVLRRLLSNPAELAEREAAIKARFTPRTWEHFGTELTQGIATGSLAAEAAPVFVPFLPSGVLFAPAAFYLLRSYRFDSAVERQQRLILSAGWDICEDFGAWMAARSAQLALRSDVAPGTAVTVYLHLALTIADTQNELCIDNGQAASLIIALPKNESRLTVRVPLQVGVGGEIVLKLNLKGPIEATETDERLLRVGLVNLSYAALNDSVARAEILESLLIGSGAVMH